MSEPRIAPEAIDVDPSIQDADHCPYCGYPDSRVVDTKRPRRRRECVACKRRYNTREVIDAA